MPATISPFQARAALYQAGRLQDEEGYMALLGTAMLHKLAWTTVQQFDRSSPTIAAVAVLLDMDDEEIDALFILGGRDQGMSPAVHDLREYLTRAPSIPANQDRAEVRLLASIVTGGFAMSLVEPIFYLLQVPASMIVKVASAAPSIWCVILAVACCLLAVLPRRFAGYASIGAAVSWIYLAMLA